MRIRLFSLLLSLTFGAAAHAEPLIDLNEYDHKLGGPPTEVLVLGTAHLTGVEGADAPGRLDPLMDRLAAWKPDVITIEAMPGQSCDTMRAYPHIFADSEDRYCPDASAAREALGLSLSEAAVALDETLANLPQRPDAATRRHLGALFLANGDSWSALVQYLYLDPSERIAADGLSPALIEQLNERESSKNESGRIGARLAHRLGLQRVYAADDHLADAITAKVGEDYGERMMQIWSSSPGGEARRQQYEAEVAAFEGGGDPLVFYRYLNSEAAQRQAVDTDFTHAMSDTAPDGYGQLYATWWQARNLRMVAHLVEAAAGAPGGRVLSVVGASHTPYFNAYLNMMHHVQPVSALDILD